MVGNSVKQVGENHGQVAPAPKVFDNMPKTKVPLHKACDDMIRPWAAGHVYDKINQQNDDKLDQKKGQRGHEEQTIQMESDTGSSDSKEWIKVSKNRNKKGKRSTKQGKIQGDSGKKVASPPLPTRESIDMRMSSGERRKRQAKSRGESHPVAQQRGPSARSANQSVVQLGYSASALCLGVQAGYSVPPLSPAARASLLSQAVEGSDKVVR
ncbi:hypothetical protein U1Q18_009840 [Sarracenia purpurea var. burkii]